MTRKVKLSNVRRNRVVAIPVAGLLAMSSALAYSQELAAETDGPKSYKLIPRLSISETFTDNVTLSSSNPQSEKITVLSPGLRITKDSGQLKAYLDYTLNEINYAENTSSRRTQNALNALGSWEAINKFAYLDFSGVVTQQAISAFGTQSTDAALSNSNQTEVSNYKLSPYLRGQFSELANYEARVSRTLTRSDATELPGVAVNESYILLNGTSSSKWIGWMADLRRRNVDYTAGRPTEDDRFDAGLTFFLSPQFSITANGGREYGNLITLDKESTTTSSVGVNWTPSPTTRLSANKGRRSFGNTHSIVFEHRTAKTAWRFNDSKDISITPAQTGSGSIYDIFFQQFAGLEPNPVARAQLVNAYLASSGINPNTVLVSNLLTSSALLQRRQDLSISLLGARSTVTMLVSQSELTRADTLGATLGDLARASVVHQQSVSLNLSHRITPDYSASVFAAQQKTMGDSSAQETRLNTLNLNLTGKVGKLATASVGVRRASFSGGSSSYGESALTFNFNMQF